jgi:hypothetical protein
MQGPSISHEDLRNRLKSEEDNLKNASAHVNNFLTTIEKAKANGTMSEQLVNELASLKATILQLIKNNDEIADFMFQQLFGLSEYQAVLMREGSPEELSRLNSDLSKKFKVRLLGNMPMEEQIEELGKSGTIKRPKNLMDASAVQGEVRRNRMNYQQLLSRLQEAREILGRQFNVNETPTTPRRYHADNF